MTDGEVSFLKKLCELDKRYRNIEKQIADPEVACDAARLIALTKEQGKLRAVVEDYRLYRGVLEDISQAEQIKSDPSTDDEMRVLADEELKQLNRKKESLLLRMQDNLVMADSMAVDAVIMEIRAGTGGEEAALFARDLYNMYTRYADSRRWKIEQLSFSPSERGGFREVIFSVNGSGVWSEFGYEGGGHRVQRVPETESQGRIHTSAATVAVLPEPRELDIKINPADVVEHVSKSGGPGGQSVNKLSSAIKLDHIPTGITVSMQDEKSQHKNRAKAWRILRGRVYEYYQKKEQVKRDTQRKTMIGSGDRSQKIRTYNFPQNRLTDHRINLSLYNLDKILYGDMGGLIAELQRYDRQQRLENL